MSKIPPIPPAARTKRGAVVGVAALSALALPAAALALAGPATADPFQGGKKVPGSSVSGDGSTTSASRATGSGQLVDGLGVKWFFNTGITFQTTSSASGAASEASFSGPIAASTLNGGTTASTLNDAFDGYNSLATFVGAGAPTGSVTTGGAVTFYEQNGAEPTSACNGRQLVYPTQVNGAVNVSRSVYVPSDAGFARWTNTVTNTGAAATTATLYIRNNLGSDNNTKIFGSSSGDTTATAADSWVGTFQNFSGTTSSDPRIGHVLHGATGPTALSEVTFADGDDNPYWTYQVSLAPGESKNIVEFAVLRGTQADAASAAAALAAKPSFTCMSAAEIAQTANFDTAKPVLSLPGPITASAPGPGGVAVTYAASATDAADGSTPVVLSRPSGSVFPIGVTTVTATATDKAGNVATGSFTVTVADPSPKISRLKLKPKTFAPGKTGKATFVLSEAATVKITIVRKGAKPIVLTKKAKAGKNTVKIKGTFKGTTLKLGSYTLVAKATDASKQKTKAKTRFTIGF